MVKFKILLILILGALCFTIGIQSNVNSTVIRREAMINVMDSVIEMAQKKDSVKEVKKEKVLDANDFRTLPLTEQNIILVMDYYGIHHQDIVLKQARLETGRYKSTLCVKYGNLFGIKGKKSYKHYGHWSESVRDYKERIQYKYRNGEDYYSFLKRIRYASSSRYIESVKKM